jgi:excisionase family DNA binding protein
MAGRMAPAVTSTATAPTFIDPVVLADPDRADVCTVADVARWLGVNKKTVYDAVNRRELPCARLGRRVLLSRAAITEWLAGRQR